MKVKVSNELSKIYKASHKNWNYSLDLLLGSLDLKTCLQCVTIVNGFSLSGEKSEIEIDNPLIARVESLFAGCRDELLVEKLIWIAAMLPEI